MSGLTGRTLGAYRLQRELGRGGMATVYLAQDLAHDRQVALKVLHAHLDQDKTVVSRFIREGRAAAVLQHPNIVRVLEAGEVEGYQYIALQYVAGGTLSQYLAIHNGVATPRVVAELMSQIAAGLTYAHDRGFVHCDIKPGNILLDKDGRALISDFGVAKLALENVTQITQTGFAVGTPAYMSPEQAKGIAELDRRGTSRAAAVLRSCHPARRQLRRHAYIGQTARISLRQCRGLDGQAVYRALLKHILDSFHPPE